MTGENRQLLPDAQPGDREPAPGELALVQSFLNTRWDLRGDRTEILVSVEALEAWFASRGLVSAGTGLEDHDLERALAVREGLRALAFSNGGRPADESAIEAMDRASAGASLLIRIDAGGPRFQVDFRAGLNGAIGALYGIVGRAMADGSWQRLKACPGRECGWVFFDQSRNQSARWCSTSVCGAREKSRAYYRRKVRRRQTPI
jgi:predicted RNA-binding Zn ribbon-like protein